MALKKLSPNRYRVTVSVRDKNRGFPVTKRVTVAGTLADAKVAEADLLKELKARSLTSAFASTFGEAVELYLRNRRERGKLSPQHERMVAFVARELGHVRIDEFVDRFEAYRKHITRSLTAHGKPRKSASVNRYTAIVRAVFGHLVDMEYVDRNPITRIRFPEIKEKARDRKLTQEERLLLLSTIRERRPYIGPVVNYMLTVPCRVSELVMARREQYNPFTDTIYIPDSKADIPIHKPVPPDMVGYFKGIPADCPWLFYRETDEGYRPITKAVLRRAWADCLKAAGLSDYRIHDLRHDAATDLYDIGNSEREIMDIAGWKTPMLSKYRHRDSMRSARKMVFPSDLRKGGEAESAAAASI
jgi:integrase